MPLRSGFCMLVSNRPRSMATTDHDVATALYTLTLGVLGFIPYPDVPVRVKKA